MKKIQFLSLCFIFILSLCTFPTYATSPKSSIIALKQPKISGEYTGLQVSLTINPNGNAGGYLYIIERSSSPDMSTDYKLVQNWSNSLVAADTVETGKMYYYRTKLKDSQGNLSPWSTPTSIKTIIYDKITKERREHLTHKMTQMSISEKDVYLSQLINHLPYTLSDEQLTESLRNTIIKSKIIEYEKEILLSDISLNDSYFLDLLGTINYKIFDNTPLGSQHPTYKDLPTNHWAYEPAKALYFAHIMPNYTDGTFHPDELISLSEALVFLDKTLKNHPITIMKHPRSEVEKLPLPTEPLSYYHIASIASKLDYKSLPLIDSKTYDLPITKEVLAQFIYSTTNGKLPAINPSTGYKDMNTTVYPQALRYCVRSGIMEGAGQMLSPKAPLTKAELAVILSKLNAVLLSLEQD